MTEADWLTGTDPGPLLHFVRDRASDRKLRLFAVAWGYGVWRRLPDDRCRDAITTAERYADGEADGAELLAAHRAAADAWREIPVTRPSRRSRKAHNGSFAAKRAAEVARSVADPTWDVRAAIQAVQWAGSATRYSLANRVRELFGNPSRPVAADPAWLTPTAVALAGEAYQSGDFSAVLPILADALQDAGCEDEQVLAHCRDDVASHVRGCWVVDLVLGKE